LDIWEGYKYVKIMPNQIIIIISYPFLLLSYISLLSLYLDYKEAKLQARIKPTTLCSAIDKENSIEFLLDFVYYLYMKSNPNPSFCPALSYELLSSHASTDKKIKKKKI